MNDVSFVLRAFGALILFLMGIHILGDLHYIGQGSVIIGLAIVQGLVFAYDVVGEN